MEEILSVKLPLWNPNQELADPDLLMLYQDLQHRHIWLEDEIEQSGAIAIVKYIQQTNRYSKDKETPIVLHIASPGGELPAMFMLYNTIRTSEIPVHTVNECGAHSAAFIVFLAGAERMMLPDATFIAHEGSGRMGGSFRENKHAMKQYEKEVERMKEIITERTSFTYEELTKEFEVSQDFYIDYKLALEKGVITKEAE